MSENNERYTGEWVSLRTHPDLQKRKENILEEYKKNDKINYKEVRLFFIVGYAMIEERSAQLIKTHIINDEFKRSIESYIDSSMSQNHRNELLNSAGIYGDEITGHIGNLASIRADLAHNASNTIEFKRENDKDIDEWMNVMINVNNCLKEAISDNSKVEEVTKNESKELYDNKN